MNPFVIPGVIVAIVAAVRGMWSPCGLSMISTITPMSERSRGHRFGVTATWFTVGGVTGGVTLGAGMAAGAWMWHLSGLGETVTVAVFACATLITVASDLPTVGFSLPIHPRQVNETWLRRYRAWAYASGFGWQIGTGFATYIMTGAVYLTAAAGVVTGSPAAAFGIGVVFGLVRGLCVFAAAGATDPARLQRLHARMERFADGSLWAAIAAQLVALIIVGVATGSALAGVASLVVVVLCAVPALSRLPTVRRSGSSSD